MDGADSWTIKNTGIPEISFEELYALVLDPSNPQTLYASYYDLGVYKTVDGGGAWTAVNTGLPLDAYDSYNIRDLAVDPNNAQNLFAVDVDGNLYKTTDGVAAWTSCGPHPDGAAWCSKILVDHGDSQTLYLTTETNGVLKSRDAGLAWEPFTTGMENAGYIRALIFSAAATPTLLAGADGQGVYKYEALHGDIAGVLTTGVTGQETPVVGAKITIQETGQSVYSNANGEYSFEGVLAGEYTLLVESPPMDDVVISGLSVAAGQTCSVPDQEMIVTRYPGCDQDGDGVIGLAEILGWLQELAGSGGQ